MKVITLLNESTAYKLRFCSIGGEELYIELNIPYNKWKFFETYP